MPSPSRRAASALTALDRAGDPLTRLAAGRQLRELAEQIEADLVRQARDDGVSWTKIGGVYGVSKQAAQQRFKRSGPKP